MLRRPSLRNALLGAVVLVFAISSVVTYKRHTDTTTLLTVALKSGAWSASELENEMLKFLHTLELFKLQQASLDKLQLQYDLLWSRVNILKVGNETKEVRALPGADKLLSELESDLYRFDSVITNLQNNDQIEVAQIQRSFRQFMPRIRELNVRSFTGPERTQELQNAVSLQQEFSIYLGGLLLSGFLLIMLTLQESIRNRYLAHHDDLTGLPNRKFFHEQLKKMLKRCARQNSHLAVYLIDLNDFKTINDSQGHDAGDKLLQEVSTRLKNCVGKQGVVGRLGGDEFAVIQHGFTDRHKCNELVLQLCQEINRAFLLDGTEVFPSASIGVSLYPEHGQEAERIMINADIAMYMAKRGAGANYRFYDAEMNQELNRRKRLAEDLKQALNRRQLNLLFQPIINLHNNRIESAEALLRWHHDEYGYISPLEVVSVAEQFGLALPLNQWVIEEACRVNMRWAQEIARPICVNVNISPAMYTQYDLISVLNTALQETNMPPEYLVVEVTEDTTMGDIDTSPDILQRMKKLGIGLALDDFGTGYSSLSHLRKMPVQKLKIDKSFIRDLNNIPKDLRFIRTIIRLAHNLDIQVVAEGIEELSHLTDLLKENCDYGQGFLFSRPQNADDMLALLQRQASQGSAFSHLPSWSQ